MTSVRHCLAAHPPAILWLFWASDAHAQTLGQGVDDGIAWWRVILVFIFCSGLALAAALLLKARMEGRMPSFTVIFSRQSNRTKRLELVENLRINPQFEVCIISCDGRELLIASNHQNIHILREILVDEQTQRPSES